MAHFLPVLLLYISGEESCKTLLFHCSEDDPQWLLDEGQESKQNEAENVNHQSDTTEGQSDTTGQLVTQNQQSADKLAAKQHRQLPSDSPLSESLVNDVKDDDKMTDTEDEEEADDTLAEEVSDDDTERSLSPSQTKWNLSTVDPRLSANSVIGRFFGAWLSAIWEASIRRQGPLASQFGFVSGRVRKLLLIHPIILL
nr:uncharacterized protein LOC128685639 [Cherax quadricarinatus]